MQAGATDAFQLLKAGLGVNSFELKSNKFFFGCVDRYNARIHIPSRSPIYSMDESIEHY